MRPHAMRMLRSRRRRVALGAALAIATLAGAIPGGLLPNSGAETAPPITVPQFALPDVPFPDLPESQSLESLLEMLPAGFDIDDLDLADLDLTDGQDIRKLLSSLPINVIDTTFKLTDTPGSWFDSGTQLFGGKSLSVMELLPGVKNKVTFVVGPETGTQTAHSATSLIRPWGRPTSTRSPGFVGHEVLRDHRAGPVRLHLQDPSVHAGCDRGRRPADRRCRLRRQVDREDVRRQHRGADVLRHHLPAGEDLLHRHGHVELAAVPAQRTGDVGPRLPDGPDPHAQGGRHPHVAALARRVLPELLPRADGAAAGQPRHRRSPVSARSGSTPSSRRRRRSPSRAPPRRSTSRTGRSPRRSRCRRST